jgi:hypothetical protein
VNAFDVIISITVMTPLALGLILGLRQNPTETFTRIERLLTRVWESIAIVFGATPPAPPAIEAKLTLDEMGMTLWEASDAHYDAAQLNRIRASHQLEHKQWLNFAGEHHWTDEERKLVGLPKARRLTVDRVTSDTILFRNWQGDVIRANDNYIEYLTDEEEAFQIEDAEDEATICQDHKKSETCYYCDKLGPYSQSGPMPKMKRQRRRR